MPETLPMLETDPRRRFNTSRLLRVGLFSFVAAAVIVSLLIVLVRFLWDNLVVGNFDNVPVLGDVGPYESNPLLVLPAMVFIALFLTKLLWDNAQQTTGAPRRR